MSHALLSSLNSHPHLIKQHHLVIRTIAQSTTERPGTHLSRNDSFIWCWTKRIFYSAEIRVMNDFMART